jgi:hypothetical protein
MTDDLQPLATPIEREFRRFAVIRGNLHFFNHEIALKIIDRSEELGVKVLGVDSFYLSMETTQPTTEHSIDLSNVQEGTHDLARKLIESTRGKPLFFEVSLDMELSRDN